MEKYTGDKLMRRNVKNFLIKAFSMCLAFILVFPTNLFAMGLDNTKTRKYKASASIMGLAQADTTGQNDNEVTDQTLLETEITKKETEKYLIEKYARLSKTTGRIEYIIKVQAKDKKAEDKVTTSFAISKNTDLKDLKIEKVSQIHSDKAQTEIKYQEEKPSILYTNDAFETLGVTTERADLVYYLSAKLTDDALANIDEKSPVMDLDVNIGEDYQDRYALTIDKTEVVGDDGQVDSIIQTLKEKDEPVHQVKSIYKEGNTSEKNPKEITWTDFIHTTDDKEFTYDINVDEGQDATDSLIKVEFYQANEKGYILKEDFTKEIPFTNSLKLQIPLGFIAKVELKTKVIKNLKEYSLNQTKIPNHLYKEEKTEEKSEEDDADPLPEESPNTGESKGTDEEKIIPIDPETNEAVIDHSLVKEDTKEESEPTKEETSAITLNRDSVINNFKNNDKLNPLVEITINNISSLFNAYNNDEMTYEEFISSLKSQASDLSKEDFAQIINGLIAGLNQETYKVATIDQAQLADEIFATEEKSEETKSETKEADTEETSNVETDINNVETETTEDLRTNEEKIKDNALESFDKSLSQAKEASKKPQEDDRSLIANVSEGIKGIFGQSNLQKADKELKEALAAGQSLEEIQSLLHELGEKYELNSKDEAKLMADNEGAIKGIIARDADQNFSPSILMAQNEANKKPIDSNKFTIRTRFDTSTAVGSIKAGQYFNIHLDEKLTVKEGTTLDPIKYNGEVIANPKYDPTNNTIVYTIAKDITDNIQVPLEIPVDYNTDKITAGKDFTVINKISGLGVTNPKELPPEKIDKNGNPAGSIIEPSRKDVTQIIEPDDSNYKINTDAYANPVVKDGELQGYNWTINVTSDTNLNELGYKINFTSVKGSGLGEITSRDSNVTLIPQLKESEQPQAKSLFGINDSKHHAPGPVREITYNLYTPVQGNQENYMLDLSVILTKQNNKVGAKRIVTDGWEKDKVKEVTPIRSGMNNRTTILGEFTSESAAKWTVTDGVSTGDTNVGLPLENRTLGNQTFNTGATATYGLDDNGRMVVKKEKSNITSLPSQGQNPGANQPVGTIAVYEVDTKLNSPTVAEDYTLAGLKISKYQDVYLRQEWGFPQNYYNMPNHTVKVTDSTGKVLGSTQTGETNIANQNERLVTIPNIKTWNINNDGKFTKISHKIVQELPKQPVTINGNNYTYSENVNYYVSDLNHHYVHNSLIKQENKKSATFDVIKVDSKDRTKGLTGARFNISGEGISVDVTTDAEGNARFTNIPQGTYILRETKAPAGYKLNKNSKTIQINDQGYVLVDGKNISTVANANITEKVSHYNWPGYMNTMHYGKIADDGTVEFYLYLKPDIGDTDKNTRLNINIDGLNITDSNVIAYDVYPDTPGKKYDDDRTHVTKAMTEQYMDQIFNTFDKSYNVINKPNTNIITGTANTKDSYTQKTGYQIKIPKARLSNDWGFMIQVKGKLTDTTKTSTNLSYDWLTDNLFTASEARIQENLTLYKENKQAAADIPKISVSNEEFPKSSVAVKKFTSENTADGKKAILPGAQFVLKDANGNVLSSQVSDDTGKVDFGLRTTGRYFIEETMSPDGYKKSNVYFEVVVDDAGQVDYTAKFKDGSGTPINGIDYWKEQGEETQPIGKAQITSVTQTMAIQENEPGDIGVKPGVWEAYRLESLKYNAVIGLSSSAPGSKFEIQFDKNLDFTQYFSDFPKIKNNKGIQVADPYFDYETNLLTYVFNEKSDGGATTANISLRGIIPSKFYAQNNGTYTFTNVVGPGTEMANTNVFNVRADYGTYDSDRHDVEPTQCYYFRDIYKGEDGKWYVKVLAYYNPLQNKDRKYSEKTLRFNWISTRYHGTNFVRYPLGDMTPAYKLSDVKVYRANQRRELVDKDTKDPKWVNLNMPLSMGIRPEQDPYTYTKVFSRKIDSNYINASSDLISMKYDASQVNQGSVINERSPLEVTVPAVSNREGYVIEQTFEITDMNKFKSSWRVFWMANNAFESGFGNGPNYNKAIGDQTSAEIPKFYREDIGIINKKYIPSKFSITKTNQNGGQALQGARFSLTDQSGHAIYRTSDSSGKINFDSIKPGIYTLKEDQAPDNFSKSNKQWKVTVFNDGFVRIVETGITASGQSYEGNNINITVTNKPVSQEFIIYKKDSDNKPLAGAKFKLTNKDDSSKTYESTSDSNGVVKFNENLTEGTYIIEETDPPAGYKKLDDKWALVIDKEGNKKVYGYVESNTEKKVLSIPAAPNTNWVDVRNRRTEGWGELDNRWTGWTAKSADPYKLGTRIIAINKTEKYVVQRYIINPESESIGQSIASIHRERPDYTNMDWYAGNEDVKVFTLNGPVYGLISDIRLVNYNAYDITNQVTKSVEKRQGEPDRLQLKLPETRNPIVIDIKVPYKEDYAGVGTGMDWTMLGQTFWKSDYYERVSDIVVGSSTTGDNSNSNIGSYISDNSLDVTNTKKKYAFSFQKIREQNPGETKIDGLSGATFKLQGPKVSDTNPGPAIWTKSGENGRVNFVNLIPGIYKLTESGPPQGYEKSNTDWTVTVTKDGKVYIRDNNPGAKINIDGKKIDKTSKLIVDNKYLDSTTMSRSASLSTYSSGLEMGDTLVSNPVSTGDGWEAIDPRITTGGSPNKVLAGDDGAPVTTKITEINKSSKRFRQEFVYSPAPYNNGVTKRNIQIHRQPENYSLTIADTTIKVYQNVNGVDKDITSNIFKESGSPLRLVADIPSTVKGTLKVKVETRYDPKFGIGLGTNYDSYVGARGLYIKHNSWVAYSYRSEAEINKRTTFNITGYSSTGGSVTADTTSSEAGKQITLNVSPQTGYRLKENSLKVTDANNGNVTVTNNSFTMPASNVTISAEFEKIPEATYSVWVNGATGGTVTATPNTNVEAGTTVNLTIEPEKDYELDKIIYRDTNAKEVTINGTSFVMPNSSVTVCPTFKQKTPPTPTKHNVTIASDIQNGRVSASPTSAAAGETVKLTVTPYDGFEIASVSMNGQALSAGPDGTYTFMMPAGEANVSAAFKQIKKDPLDNFTPGKDDILITDGTTTKPVQITNKQAGITPKILKKNSNGRPLQGAKFTLKKMTDGTYNDVDSNFESLKGTSDENGNVSFKDSSGNEVKLNKGYYVLTEEEAPVGYKKIAADWKIEVKDDGGRMHAVYNGPTDTPSSFVEDNTKANAGESLESDIKFKSRVTYINPDAKLFVQRIYIDTRNYNGDDLLNVQITPKNKREEIDTPGKPPQTTKSGVKTAYRTTYQIANPENNADIKSNNLDKILRTYDLSKPDMSMLNTARWRPFDWGFDEDQLNLGKGVYIIDVEGYFDENITKEDIGKIDLHVDLYKGARKFEQVTFDENGREVWYDGVDASYQAGVENIKKIVEANEGINKANSWFGEKPQGQKYANYLSKKVTYNGKEYIAGRVTPSIEGNPYFHADTSINIKPIYSSDKANEIPQEGMTVINDEESFNITFTKLGRDNPDWDPKGNEVANRRLEGGIFKLQQLVGNNYEDLPESYVSSAFNGYFGFRSLKPGRYRLMEVKAPKGYKPITDPLLYLTIAYNEKDIRDEKTGEIIAGKGSGYVSLEYTNAKGVYEYLPEKATTNEGKLVDYVTSATAKHMGKIVNEKLVDNVQFKKVNKDSQAIKDAEFEVWYKRNPDDNLYTKLNLYEKTVNDNYTERMVNKAGDPAPEGFTKVDKFTSGIDGLLDFKLDAEGYYAIKEIKAPSGYITPRRYVKEFSYIDSKVEVKDSDGKYKPYDKSKQGQYNIVNDKSSFPLTGGNGVFMGFAIIGTAVMLLALAYFGIYQNDKNRRKSARYKK